MDGYQRRTEKKKESIRNGAFKLFNTYGIERVSVSEIAKEANVSPVTIYNYFGSKEDLLKEVITHYMNTEVEHFIELLHSDLTFQQKLEKIVFNKRESVKTLSTDFLKSIIDPSLKSWIEDFTNQKAIPLLMELIEQGRNEGQVNPDISSEAILLYIQTMSEATKNTELFSNYSMDVLLEFSNLFFYGLLGQPANVSAKNKKGDRP